MFVKVKLCLIEWAKRIKRLADLYDLCEVCYEDGADYICVGCDRHICGICTSDYYRDAELCIKCRAEITPEEEDNDRRESAQTLAEECTCGTGGRPCDLSDEEHEFLKKYAPVKEKNENRRS